MILAIYGVPCTCVVPNMPSKYISPVFSRNQLQLIRGKANSLQI